MSFTCGCDKQYSILSNLNRHKKTCKKHIDSSLALEEKVKYLEDKLKEEQEQKEKEEILERAMDKKSILEVLDTM